MGKESGFMGTDAVLSEMRRRLQDQGVAFADISMAISAELGISLETLWAYDDVVSAIHRYQMRQFFPELRQARPASTGEPALSRAEHVGESESRPYDVHRLTSQERVQTNREVSPCARSDYLR